MSSVRIFPTPLKGPFAIPSSKSHTMRALIFAAKASSPSILHNLLPSPDTDSMISALKTLGTKINDDHITPKPWKIPSEAINAGNSGLVYRFIQALAPVKVTGDASIQTRRPIKPLLDGLSQISSGHATIDGSDSQPVSAMLIHMAFLKGTHSLTVNNPGEKPWVAMTLNWFDRLNIPYTNDDFTHYTVTGPANYPGFTYTVPPDLSSASFPWAINLITPSKLQFTLPDDPTQGDGKLFSLNPLNGGTIDVNPIIDTLPILTTLGCFAKAPLTLINGAIARQKESDRIHAICTELTKMGADITENQDGLTIRPTRLHGAELDSHLDHRIAMALIVAALGASSPSIIHDVDCIAKSYPNFIQEIQKCASSSVPQVLENQPLATA